MRVPPPAVNVTPVARRLVWSLRAFGNHEGTEIRGNLLVCRGLLLRRQQFGGVKVLDGGDVAVENGVPERNAAFVAHVHGAAADDRIHEAEEHALTVIAQALVEVVTGVAVGGENAVVLLEQPHLVCASHAGWDAAAHEVGDIKDASAAASDLPVSDGHRRLAAVRPEIEVV